MNIVNLENREVVNTATPAVTVGARYSMARTSDILEVLEGHGWNPVDYRERRVLSEERRGKQAHTIVLSNSHYEDGSTRPRIMLKNSHDGSGSLQFLAGMYEMICANGLLVGATASDIRIRHLNLTESKILGGIETATTNLHKAITLVESMRSISLDRHQQIEMAEEAVGLAYDIDKYAINPAHLLFNHRRDQRVPTLWNTFNTIQERIVRGGVEQRREDGSRIRARAISSIDRSIKVNRALWDLAETRLQMWQ